MKIVLLTAIVILTAAASALAQLPKQNNGDIGVFCLESSGVDVGLKTTGAYLPGSVIGIRADPLRMWAKTPVGPSSRVCKATVRDVPQGNWHWQLIERPADSTSHLAGTSNTTVNLLLDRPGVYKIRFLACVFGCEITVPNYGNVSIDSGAAEIEVRVLAIFPPDKNPVVPVYNPLDQTTLPFQPTNKTSVTSICAFHNDVLSPAWYTVLPWNGASDYKLLEGKVNDSWVSSSDSFLNHNSNDWNMGVEPHPWSRSLLGLNQTKMEVEWERSFLPERMRPSEGDWISAIGYWIYDCGHEQKTEIHPPVLLASQRPRAIALPASAGAGSNVYVPGIVTDIWVNDKAGGITDDCAQTGLHQQIVPAPIVNQCLPRSKGFSSNPINRVFTFNIYLPRSPQAIMAAVGKTAPPVPLFIEGCASFTPGALPRCEVAVAGGVTYLKVTLDLTNYTEHTFAGRIIAAWSHAAPDNWGARRWDVRITSLDVSDDGDTWSDGDWRFWVNTNNGDSEWAKLFDCGGCVHGNMTFGGVPWATNAPNGEHSLGPSIVLFPNQLISVATRGFESERFDDSISSLSLRFTQSQILNGRAVADDGTGKYTMHYEVLPGPEIGPPQLSDAAQRRYDAYLLTNSEPLGGIHGPLDGVFDAGFRRPTLPSLTDVKVNNEAMRSIMRMSVPELQQMFKRAKRDKRNLDGFFTDLKRVLYRAEGSDGKEQACEFLTILKLAISRSQWKKYGLDAGFCVPAKSDTR